MEDSPYDFIDSNAPEKRETNRRMAKAAREGELFGSSNNSNSNTNRSDDESMSINTDKGGDGNNDVNRPFLLRLVNRLFRLFE